MLISCHNEILQSLHQNNIFSIDAVNTPNPRRKAFCTPMEPAENPEPTSTFANTWVSSGYPWFSWVSSHSWPMGLAFYLAQQVGALRLPRCSWHRCGNWSVLCVMLGRKNLGKTVGRVRTDPDREGGKIWAKEEPAQVQSDPRTDQILSGLGRNPMNLATQ